MKETIKDANKEIKIASSEINNESIKSEVKKVTQIDNTNKKLN